MFKIGEEVVCIDDKFADGSTPLKKGQYYIIRWQGFVPTLEHEGPCVRVEGIVRNVSDQDRFEFDGIKALVQIAQRTLPLSPEQQEQIEGLISLTNRVDELLLDFPFRATRFAPIHRKTNHVEELKSLLLTKTKVLENV